MKRIIIGAAIAMIAVVSGCGGKIGSGGSKGINLFTLDQDRQFGAQVAAEIASDTKNYPVLDSASNKEVYAYIYKIRNKILNSGQVTNKNEFQWKIQVINNDTVINAFCTPGGYIYVYTGIMKFLESEDQLAGVLGHEIAHADLRHSTRQMTTQYGIQVLLDALAGDRESLKQITAGLAGLKFSRNHEEEADERSVHYLCPTDYNAAGGAGFFEKLEKQGGASVPEFLSTHPNPENRIENYHNHKTSKGCTGTQTYQTEYQRIVAKLPRS